MKVKLILPALTGAINSYWQSTKYLFIYPLT